MSTHHGFIKEFPFIRCDAFDGSPEDVNPYSDDAPHFYLLTHAHSDHLTGLSSPSFHGLIYCTPITKHLLLNTMEAGERVRYEETRKGDGKKRYKFGNLGVVRKSRGSSGGGRGSRGSECIREININEPMVIQGPEGTGSVRVTALDANHCPGSCMYLIEGPSPTLQGRHTAVLITGDIRAETWWIDALERNPILGRYLPRTSPGLEGEGKKAKGKKRATEDEMRGWREGQGQENGGVAEEKEALWEGLECVYLDTSLVLLDVEFPTKKEAVEDTVELMALYPPKTKFFLNSWTWGYEDLLKGVSRAFNTKIHLDWYKSSIYTSPSMSSSDSLLSSLSTPTPTSTRFHACERRWKCDEVWCDGLGCYIFEEEDLDALRGEEKKFKRPGKGEGVGIDEVVYVNPVSMGREKWGKYKDGIRELARNLEAGEDTAGEKLPNHLVAPLARHSPLPELQRFIQLFKPRTIYPLTIADDKVCPGRDYRSLPTLFAGRLAEGGVERLDREAREYTSSVRRKFGVTGTNKMEVAMEEEMDVFMGGGSGLPEELASKLAMNLEGGEGIARIVEEWTREQKTEVPLHSSPSREGRKRRPTSVELRSPTRRSPSRKSRPAPSTPPVRFALSTPSDPPSPSSPSNRKTTKDSSSLLPSIVLTSSRPIDPMASSLPPSSLVSEPPHPRPAPIASFLTATTSSKDPSTFNTFPPPGQKSVAFASSPPSPELRAPTPTPPRPSSPNVLSRSSLLSFSPNRPKITARPSLEGREKRREAVAAIVGYLKGRVGSNGKIVPLETDDPYYHLVAGERESPSSFKTVSATPGTPIRSP